MACHIGSSKCHAAAWISPTTVRRTRAHAVNSPAVGAAPACVNSGRPDTNSSAGLTVNPPANTFYSSAYPGPALSCPADPPVEVDGKFWKKIKNAAKRAGRWAWRNKVDIGLTAAGFIPGLGAAAWAVRGYRAYRAVRTARTAARTCRANSFTPDTKIWMADGSHKAISEVSIGDLVVASDPTTGYTAAKPVTDVVVGAGIKDLVQLDIDSNGDGVAEAIIATGGHPLYVDGSGWTDAGDVVQGDSLFSPGDIAPIVVFKYRYYRTQTVYNLTVAYDLTCTGLVPWCVDRG
jgi:Pretoxin HINT domain